MCRGSRARTRHPHQYYDAPRLGGPRAGGAGTLVVAADAARRLSSLKGQEARVLALLSAAYNRAVPPSVLGNIERAANSWREGDDSLAYIHLAHAGLPELQDSREAARRLFLADG